MPDLIQDLARIRQMQGKPPLPNPMTIQGFGPDDPPPPAFPPGGSDRYNENLDPDDNPMTDLDDPPSPLIPRQIFAPISGGGSSVPANPVMEFELSVIWLKGGECVGVHRGRDVTLDQNERKAVAKIVLRAIARTVNQALREVGGATPRTSKRGRKAKA